MPILLFPFCKIIYCAALYNKINDIKKGLSEQDGKCHEFNRENCISRNSIGNPSCNGKR
jgi:hypothetical protein